MEMSSNNNQVNLATLERLGKPASAGSGRHHLAGNALGQGALNNGLEDKNWHQMTHIMKKRLSLQVSLVFNTLCCNQTAIQAV